MKRYEKDAVQSHPVFAKIRNMCMGSNPKVNTPAVSFVTSKHDPNFVTILLPRNRFWCNNARKLKREGQIEGFALRRLCRDLLICGLLTEDEVTSLNEARARADKQHQVKWNVDRLGECLSGLPPEMEEAGEVMRKARIRYLYGEHSDDTTPEDTADDSGSAPMASQG